MKHINYLYGIDTRNIEEKDYSEDNYIENLPCYGLIKCDLLRSTHGNRHYYSLLQ